MSEINSGRVKENWKHLCQELDALVVEMDQVSVALGLYNLDNLSAALPDL